MGKAVFFNNNSGSSTVLFKYEQHWDNETLNELELLSDINKICENKNFSGIETSEFTVKNNNISAKLEFKIIDNGITVLDILLEPEDIQKYLLGISRNVKIFLKGTFTANLYINAYCEVINE